MASADLRDELTCCICLNIYTDPATLTCGHSYCRVCITRTWDNQEERENSCPECRRRFRVRPELERNLRMCNMAESFRSTHPEQEVVGIPCTYCIHSSVPAAKTCLLCEASLCETHLRVHSQSAEHILTEPTTSLGNRKCSVHKKVLEYYCSVDAACICVSCSLAGDHRGHQVETLNKASEKKKEKLRNILQKLISKREEAEKRVQNLQKLRKEVPEKAAGVTEEVTALIRGIREHLEALEKRVLSEISRQEEQVSLRVSDIIRQLEIKKEDLSRKMGHIEELCNMTDPLTVLQGWESDSADYCDPEEGDNEADYCDTEEGDNEADYCDTEEGDNEDRERHDKKVRSVGDLDVILISVTLHSGLAGIVTGVKRQLHVPGNISLGIEFASDLLLDVNTASNDVTLSDDMKTVSWSGIDQRRPGTRQRFQTDQVLSSSSFSSGRHYWEVEGSESGWRGVGMAYPSIGRKEYKSWVGCNIKSWGLWRHNFNRYYVKHDLKEINLPHHQSSQRLGIYLDYEAGRLSFYELCDPIRHLHTFTATFTEPLHAIFGVHEDNTWLRIY
ncbi:E3 ubiquitin-protein ligase TRIM21 [Pelobates fuscus]|uniref:E3 ubiquitin-protein ligase TRIM21 n=1 Tax=Pelobates fuscus TaxID=191477 RepID=UPI002FE4C6FA